jgi:hypothetical protein
MPEVMLAWLNENSAAITAVAAMVGAIAAFFSWICTVVSDRRTRDKLNTVHVQINSRVDQLIAAARQAGLLEGRSERDDDGDAHH